MSDKQQECEERQEDEILAMTAILAESDSGSLYQPGFEELPRSASGRRVRMRIPAQFFSVERTVIIQPGNRHLLLSDLPPVEVTIALPKLYPIESPPALEESRAPWLKTPLSIPIQRIWHDAGGMECLMYISEWLSHDMWMENGPFMKTGDIVFDLKTIEAAKAICSLLITHNAAASKAGFEARSFECVICLSSSRGDRCLQLRNCKHAFCRSCLEDGITFYAREGDFRAARICPTLECGEARKEQSGSLGNVDVTELDLTTPDPAVAVLQRSAPSSLKELLIASRLQAHRPGYLTRAEQRTILGPELLARVERLELENIVGQDVYSDFCPICKSVALAAEESMMVDEDGKPGFGSLLICTKCEFPFCRMCGHAWHGRTRCGQDRGALADQYSLALGNKDEDTIQDLERRFSQKYLQHLVHVTATSKESREWIENNTKPCPRCRVPVAKIDGCNHIHCLHCSAHFCWRCGDSYSGSNFYDHYSDRRSRCYNSMVDIIDDNNAFLDNRLF